MKKQTHHFIIGLFVLSAVALLVLAGIFFGGGRLFQEKIYFETYFDSSVQGLDKGSAVQLRGVTIGEVESISFASVDYADDLENASAEELKALRYVRVVCSIDVKKHPNFSTEKLESLKSEAGLVTSLSMQGITGGMLINLDFTQTPKETLPFAWTPMETYIPSQPTTLENIISVTERVATNLEKIDFSETVDAITVLTNRLTGAIDDANVEHLSTTISNCASSMDSLAQHVDALLIAAGPEFVGENVKSISGSLVSVSKTLEQEMPTMTQQANQTFASAQTSIDTLNTMLVQLMPLVQAWTGSEEMEMLPTDVADSVEQLSETLMSLEALLDLLRERPSRLIFDDEE